MRLISAHIQGYGRIVDSKINLDTKVVAVVGPNEAGKTTLLKALAYVDGGAPVPLPERSRGAKVADHTPVTTFEYVLQREDQDALDDLDLHEQPKRAKVTRAASGGELSIEFIPQSPKIPCATSSCAPNLEVSICQGGPRELDRPEHNIRRSRLRQPTRLPGRT